MQGSISAKCCVHCELNKNVVNMKVYKIRMLHKKLFYPNVLEVRLVADQTDLHGGTAVRELN